MKMACLKMAYSMSSSSLYWSKAESHAFLHRNEKIKTHFWILSGCRISAARYCPRLPTSSANVSFALSSIAASTTFSPQFKSSTFPTPTSFTSSPCLFNSLQEEFDRHRVYNQYHAPCTIIYNTGDMKHCSLYDPIVSPWIVAWDKQMISQPADVQERLKATMP